MRPAALSRLAAPLAAAGLLLLTTHATIAQQPPCCNCPIPTVGIFDFTQNITPPGLPAGSANYSSLDHRLWNSAQAGFLQGYAPEVANNPTCTVHFTTITMGDQYENFVHGGFSPGNEAVSGDFDYLLQGSVIDTGGRYGLKVVLADGTTNDEIWEVNESFSSEAGAAAAGSQAAVAFAPFFDHICDYWRKKRQENTENAVQPKLTLTPASQLIHVGDSTSVAITARDCDDSPLPNRKIQLSSDNGTFSPQTVTVDDNGKATVQFRAARPGVATLKAEHEYTSIVKHKPNQAYGYQAIQVDDPPTGTWRLVISVTETDELSIQHTRHQGNVASADHETKIVIRNANLTVLIHADYDPATATFSGSDVVGIAGGGSASVSQRVSASSNGPDGSGWMVGRTEGDEPIDRTNLNAFSFEASPDRASIAATIPFAGTLSDFRRTASSRATPCCGRTQQTIDDAQAIEFGLGNNQIDITPTPQMIKDGVYRFTLSKSETDSHPEDGATDTHQRSGTITLEQLKHSSRSADRSP